MSWKTQNAAKRMYNFLKRNKTKAFPEDVDAFKIVIAEIESIKKQQAVDNVLFTKLLAIHFKNEILRHGSISLAVKNTSKDLGAELSYNIESLRLVLNDAELNAYLKSIGISGVVEKDGEYTFPKSGSDDQVLKDHQKEIISKMNENFTFKTIESKLYNSSNEFIRDVNNYK